MKRWLIGIGVSLLVIAIAVFMGFKYVMHQIHGSVAQKEFDVHIEPGESLKSVLTQLEENGLVGNAQWRYLYMRFEQPDYIYKAGDYHIEQGTTLEQALQKFESGDVLDQSFKVTIPEGWTVKQILTRFSEQNVGDEETFRKLLFDPDYYEEKRLEYPFLPPLADNIKSPFEGYLFPETYHFPDDVSEEEVIEEMLGQTQRVLDKLKAEYPTIDENPHELFTLASIIEKETTVEEERPRVAGVFFNRLEKDWKLESDATVQYVLDKRRDRLLYEDLEVQDPYNTYRNKGLPPGPIASPGLTSLTAVLAPEQNDFLFFVTKKDGSQAHYFARTFAEHKENRAKSEKHRRRDEQN